MMNLRKNLMRKNRMRKNRNFLKMSCCFLTPMTLRYMTICLVSCMIPGKMILRMSSFLWMMTARNNFSEHYNFWEHCRKSPNDLVNWNRMNCFFLY